MKLQDIRLGVSPLTDRIYLGTVNKRQPDTWASKEDCTNEFIGAVLQWTPPGNVRRISDGQGNTFEITVRQIVNPIPN